MQQDIQRVLQSIYGEKVKYFEITLCRDPDMYVVRVNPDMYEPDSYMRDHLSYIHIIPNESSKDETSCHTAQLFDLDIKTGIKRPVCSPFRGGLYEILQPMERTLIDNKDLF